MDNEANPDVGDATTVSKTSQNRPKKPSDASNYGVSRLRDFFHKLSFYCIGGSGGVNVGSSDQRTAAGRLPAIGGVGLSEFGRLATMQRSNDAGPRPSRLDGFDSEGLSRP